MKILGSTVRLQFNSEFTFDHASACVDYYARLGITHYYASPIYTARAGSGHGYDVVDFSEVNPELGGETALRAMVARLRERGMGLVVDIVPNHMAVGEADNDWWLDVLEWGEASPYAQYFDIDWLPPDEALHGKLLAPFLGKPFEDALADGDLVLGFAPERGRFEVEYGPHRFPITPADYAEILAGAADDESLPASLATLRSDPSRDHAAAASRDLLAWVSTDAGGKAMAACLGRYRSGRESNRENCERLAALLRRQHYLLADWHEASRRINWRRFFDVTSLAAIRADRDEVFEATHAMPLRLYREGLIDGFRIDHIDGLADPAHYLARLRERLDRLHAERPQEFALETPWLVVEKILARGEILRRDWQADGATGYKFMDAVSGLLHDPAGEAPLTIFWQDISDARDDAAEQTYRARKELAQTSFGADIDALTALVARHACAVSPDSTVDETGLKTALLEFLAHFPTYRSYVSGHSAGWQDRVIYRRVLALLTEQWIQQRPGDDHVSLDVLHRWIESALEHLPKDTADDAHLAHAALQRMQKLLPALDAKSVEDTVFYRYGRLLSRNEVGSWPGQFAFTPDEFHALNQDRAARVPRALTATATHDQKRGEDARMRLAVLSELPQLWATTTQRLHSAARLLGGGQELPELTDEIMLYQSMVGSWPPGLKADDRAGIDAFVERMAGWQQKALREAKLHSSWAEPNAAYEDLNRAFLEALTADPSMLETLTGFVDRIAPYAALNGLAQTLLRITSPGVPDLYQGTDFWDFSLVDPDNRRPVDYQQRLQALDADLTPASLLESWRDGRIKQALIARTLALRGKLARTFETGSYERLTVLGPQSDSVLAFMRRSGSDLGSDNAGDVALIIITRLAARCDRELRLPLVPAACWQDTRILLPADAPATLDDALNGDVVRPLDGQLELAATLTALPVALLHYRI